MINDNIKLTGNLEIILIDQYGNIKYENKVPNLVVTTGKTALAARLAGTTVGVFSHMAVGTGSTAAVVANTTLAAEIASSRRALSVSGGTPVNNEVTYTAVFPAGVGTGNIVEAGLFNASTAGAMLARTVFASVNKDVGDSLTINWKISIN